MAAGDIMDVDDVDIMVVTFGSTVTVGQVVGIAANDGKWDPLTNNALGKIGVALDAGGDGDEGRVLIRGKVEVTASAAAIAKGELVTPATTGLVRKYAVANDSSGNTVFATAFTAFESSGNGTIAVGLM